MARTRAARARQERALGHVAALAPDAPPVPGDLRVTLNFHPDRSCRGVPVLRAMAEAGAYRSQFATGTSNGGTTARPGGDRWRWESRLFGGAYDDCPPGERPVYGALNFRHRPVGAAPRFGSSHFRLRPEASARATYCYPDSSTDPAAVATAQRARCCQVKQSPEVATPARRTSYRPRPPRSAPMPASTRPTRRSPRSRPRPSEVQRRELRPPGRPPRPATPRPPPVVGECHPRAHEQGGHRDQGQPLPGDGHQRQAEPCRGKPPEPRLPGAPEGVPHQEGEDAQRRQRAHDRDSGGGDVHRVRGLGGVPEPGHPLSAPIPGAPPASPSATIRRCSFRSRIRRAM
nr:DUF3626 domain-containing protein [Streptomyces odorifer]